MGQSAAQGSLQGAAQCAGQGATADDLIHLRGPLTEDAVVRALQARFYQNKFYVSGFLPNAAVGCHR